MSNRLWVASFLALGVVMFTIVAFKAGRLYGRGDHVYEEHRATCHEFCVGRGFMVSRVDLDVKWEGVAACWCREPKP